MKVCLKLVPDNKTFMDAIGARDESYDTLREDIDTLSSLLTPILKEIYFVLVINYLIINTYSQNPFYVVYIDYRVWCFIFSFRINTD